MRTSLIGVFHNYINEIDCFSGNIKKGERRQLTGNMNKFV